MKLMIFIIMICELYQAVTVYYRQKVTIKYFKLAQEMFPSMKTLFSVFEEQNVQTNKSNFN